jgi:PAS domain S-box-containing protein
MPQHLLLQPVFENVLAAILFGDMEGNLIEANEAACKMLGYTKTELLQLGRAGIVVTDAASEKMMQERMVLGKAEGIMNFRRKNGEIFKAKVSSNIIKDDKDKTFLCISFIDLSAEEKLQTLLHEVSHMASIGGYAVNINTGKISWTSAIKQIYEVPLDYEPERDTVLLFFKEGESRDKLLHLIKAMKISKKGWDEEFLITTAKGNERWVRVICEPEKSGGQLVAVKGVIQDIHSKKILESEVKEKSETISRILDSSLDIIAVLTPDGKRRFVSDSAYTIFGYDSGELQGQSIFDMICPEDKDNTLTILNNVKALNGAAILENRIIKKDGSLVTMSWSYKWNDESGSIYAIGRDVTANKKMEEELRLSEKKFRSIIDNLNVGIVKHKPCGEVMLCNRSALQMLGLSKDQLLGITPQDPSWNIIHEDGTNFFRQYTPGNYSINQ